MTEYHRNRRTLMLSEETITRLLPDDAVVISLHVSNNPISLYVLAEAAGWEPISSDVEAPLDRLAISAPFTPCRTARRWGECVLVHGHEKLEGEGPGMPPPAPNHVDRYGRSWGVAKGGN